MFFLDINECEGIVCQNGGSCVVSTISGQGGGFHTFVFNAYFHAYIHLRFKHRVLAHISGFWALCLGQYVSRVCYL